MAKESKYFDRVLLKLKRQYGKEEYIAALLKKISDLEIENGKLISEKDEAVYNLEQALKLPEQIKSKIGARSYYRKKIVQIKKLQKQVKSLKIENQKIFQDLIKHKNR
jgi:hypothetical protein